MIIQANAADPARTDDLINGCSVDDFAIFSSHRYPHCYDTASCYKKALQWAESFN
jgi:hypothetical protein